MLLAVITLLLVFSFFANIIAHEYWYRKSLHSKEEKREVVLLNKDVVRKRTKYARGLKPKFKTGMTNNYYELYFKDKVTDEGFFIFVEREDFVKFAIGDEGELATKGYTFIGFKLKKGRG